MHISSFMNSLQSRASKVAQLPLLRHVSPTIVSECSAEQLAGFQKAQELAIKGARTIGAMIQEGWTEKRAATMLDQWLKDHGCHSFFHQSFAWWGDRTVFRGVRTYADYKPTNRRIVANEVFILDVAPILDGFSCDIGHTSVLGNDPELSKAKAFLKSVRDRIPSMFDVAKDGASVCRDVDKYILEAGYANIHHAYPFSVLGHRLHVVPQQGPEVSLLNFGWRSYWSLLSRGLFGQLLNENHEGEKFGLWAIEPHIGKNGFGAKFEEILVVTPKGSRWLVEKNVDVEP